jgi:hypothetical protein
MSNGWKPSITRLESLKEVADMGQSDYEESWAWIHFMLHSGPSIRETLVAYLADLRTNADAEPLSSRIDGTMLAATDRFSNYVASLNTFGWPDGSSAQGRHGRDQRTADASNLQ